MFFFAPPTVLFTPSKREIGGSTQLAALTR